MLLDHTFTCPCCWQTVTMVLDLSVPEQSYVEDCEVCCRPLHLQVEAEEGELVRFDVEALE